MARRTRTTGATDETNPLDVPDAVFGRNPRELSQAVRRSVGRTEMATTGATGKASRRARSHRVAAPMSGAEARHRGSAADERAERTSAPVESDRKGGPGKRRPTPKKGRKQGGR